MVVKQTLPDMKVLVNSASYVIILIVISSCDIFKQTSALQYCWKGIEDDLSGWKNQSCVTGRTTLGNSLSTKLLPGRNGGSIPATGSFHCLAFKHYETVNEGYKTTVKTYKVEYGCDLEHACSGREMNKGFSFEKNGSEGILYCCNDVNNCNKHSIILNQQHTKKCYKAFSDGVTHTIDVETCPSEDIYCIMEIKKKSAVDQRFRVVNESYRCDVSNMCEESDLADSLDKACKSSKDPQTNIETELCCCKGDTCFTPKWIGDGEAHTVMDTGPEPNGIQRTILIGIGIAIGLLVAAFALFIVIRYKRSVKASKANSKANSRMVYSSVLEGDDLRDEDNVNILTTA